MNQIRKCSSNVPDNGPAEDVAMDVIYDTFDILTPFVILEVHRSKRKGKVTDLLIGLVCWVLWHINLCRLFNAKSIFM